MSGLQKKVQLSRLPPMPPAGLGLGGSHGGKKGMMRGKRDFTPLSWDRYYEEKEHVQVGANTFCVYRSGHEGPVCLFLHGGGFSGLSWSLVSKVLTGLVACRCLAIDLRGHGESSTTNDLDLSADTLARDVGDIVRALYGEDLPPVLLIGHSMGGAIAVHTAVHGHIPSLIGLVVIDVVEGTALDALGSMNSFLSGRPSMFRSLEHAIEWCVKTGTVRNLESARVSMAGQVKKKDRTQSDSQSEDKQAGQVSMPTSSANIIQEEEEEDEGNKKVHDVGTSSTQPAFPKPPDPANSAASTPTEHFIWRLDLSKTERFWKGWFQGLSQKFLSCGVPKMLLLAGVDRLDKDLTVGQMQGKFQMQVLPQSGHAVHEDVPDKVADILATFMVRHKVAEPATNFQRTFPAC